MTNKVASLAIRTFGCFWLLVQTISSHKCGGSGFRAGETGRRKEAPPRFELGISCLLDRRFNQLSHGAVKTDGGSSISNVTTTPNFHLIDDVIGTSLRLCACATSN